MGLHLHPHFSRQGGAGKHCRRGDYPKAMKNETCRTYAGCNFWELWVDGAGETDLYTGLHDKTIKELNYR